MSEQAKMTKDELIEHLVGKIQELSWEVFFYEELLRIIKDSE